MNAVGIDVSKGKSMIAVVRPFGEVVVKPYEVPHTTSELRKLAGYLKSLDGETRAILEHTGRYYEPVAQILHNSGIFVCAVNPKLIKDYGNNSLRRVKTDKADSMKIARYGLDNWIELRQHTPMDTIRYQLKTMNRQYGLYNKSKIAMKNNLIALLDQTYPGANALFSSPTREDGSQKWVDFAASFWHVDCVRCMGQTAFIKRYHTWCQRHGYNFNSVKASEIHTQAKNLIAMLPKDSLTKLLLRQAIDQLNVTARTVELLRTEMKRLAQQLPEYPVVMSLYGVGESLGPQLMAEIGDVMRFERRNSLTAFAGVDPGANQSGRYEAKSSSVSKHGSPELRKTLFLVMDVLIKKAPSDDPVFCFMDKKRAEGKPYFVYMTAGANKFLRIYYGKVKEYLASLTTTE
ncbi:IS110 family transposase [Sporomusa sphaeroides]|uniref:Transposase IS116/IS110/IS902 family protein n=1 Tax=Sporomusa sphaeroides DSM 2875 TaxID=1337886 RepID=A0ABM9W6L7_9FIRM|nr:IS110 family transposase [Sporomusa sphaeroides]OLS58498.1 transposase IS116/IS110/IS902 family protein [Sporomusa sphaeroides DSM 2875]CVK19638.1 Transposase IS116/IS110/IS902 family protein [Sporomusa sphaeroides DSM 2875]